jgi:hypothetical protein
MGYFKNLEVEIREMDFKGYSAQKIADTVGLSVKQIIDLLESDFDDDPYEYAENAADLDAEYYGNV